jgi:hypothetical protein
VTIDARSEAAGRLVLPIVCTQQQPVARAGAQVVHVGRDGGRIVVECDAGAAFESIPERRIFNLVPGFQCVPLAVALAPGRGVRVTIRVLRS